MQAPDIEKCHICGGDGTIDNSFGSRAKCPSCHGSGRRRVDTGFHDVTKTKPSHHGPTNLVKGAPKETKPTTAIGMRLAADIEKSTTLSAETKAKLTLEIYDHEAEHGLVTKTFVKKMRKTAGLGPG